MLPRMNRVPRVSVVIAFLNGERFLTETIESVFRQTYDNWELLLVDDGSTDRSTTIARDWSSAHPQRVRYFDHPNHANRGVCASRNLGIHESLGELIATLDADDVWQPTKLEQQVAILDAHPRAAMVFGASEYWSSWTTSAGRDFTPDVGVEPNRLYEPPSLLKHLYPLARATAPCPSDLLMRRSAVERIGGFEEDFHGIYQLYEDQAFLTKMYLHAPVYVASASWLRYRLHEGSCDSQVTAAGAYHRVRAQFLNWFERYLRNEKVTDPEIWTALRRAQFPYHHPRLHALQLRVEPYRRRHVSRMKRVARRTLPRVAWQWLRGRIGTPA